MKKTSLFLCLASAVSLSAQNRSITFDASSFVDLKAKAAQENKLIFIDAYTTWCGPCRLMASTVFMNDTAADFYNPNFINAKIDMEKGEGMEIAKLYEVTCYPTYLFLDGSGKLIHRVSGSMSTAEFVDVGKNAKHPDNNFSALKAKYESNKSDAGALLGYLKAVKMTCIDPGDAVKNYFAGQKDADLTKKNNWEMINDFTNSIDSREFKYLVANKAKFEKLYTAKAVDAKIDDVARTETFKAMRSGDEAKMSEVKSKIEALHLSNGKEIIVEADMSMAKKKKDWDTYTKLAVANVDAYYLSNANKLNSIAWTFYENVTDKAALAKAEEWAKKASELHPTYATLDTYTGLLYRNGKKELAEETATKAIRYAKSDKQDYQSTADLLEKIKAMK